MSIERAEEWRELQFREERVRQEIFRQIDVRREKQDKAHGGPEHDDTHTPNDWHSFIVQYSVRYVGQAQWGNDVKAREALIDVAALAVAAIEALDRKEGPTI